MSGGDRLAGRRIVLTGASSGIGLAAALALANEGADLALLARGERGLERAVELAHARGVQAYALPVDVGDREGLEAAVDEAAQLLGGIDVFISNAAATAYGPFSEVAPDDFDRTVEVTLLGATHGVRAVLPHLERTHGTVIGVASILSRVPMPLFASYVAAKHGLRGFLGSLRIELRAQGSRVKVAMVHPGHVDTPFWDRVQSSAGGAPPLPPAAYDPHAVAEAIVDCAVRPRAEVTVGGAAVGLGALFAVARPLVDRLMSLEAQYLLARTRPTGEPSALWSASGDGTVRPRGNGRPSALGTARAARLLTRLLP